MPLFVIGTLSTSVLSARSRDDSNTQINVDINANKLRADLSINKKNSLQRTAVKPTILNASARPVPYQSQSTWMPPMSRNHVSPSKSRCSPTASGNRQGSPQKSPSPTKPPSLPMRSSSSLKQMSPNRTFNKSADSTKNIPSSPQPRTFGASTFYLPQTENPPSTLKASSRKSSLNESISSSQQSGFCLPRSSPCVSSQDNSLSNNKGIFSSKANKLLNLSSKSYSVEKNAAIGTSKSLSSVNSCSQQAKVPSRSYRSDPSFGKYKSTTPVSSHSPSPESESTTETTFFNRSVRSESRETSVESDASIVMNYDTGSVPKSTKTSYNLIENKAPTRGDWSSSGTHGLVESAEVKKSPEKRKSASSEDEAKGKDKRRSCDLDDYAEEQFKKTVSLKTG